MSIAEIRRMADLGSGKVLTRPGGTLRRETNSRRVQGSSASVAERPVAEREGARSSICDPSQSPIIFVAAMSISEIIRLKRTEALAKTAVSV